MAKKIERLSTTLLKVLKAQGMEGRLSEYRIVGQWEQAVGAAIARHAQPVAVRAKKLVLVVDSPAWMQQLSLMKPEIMEKLNQGLGRDGIKDITLKLGEVAVSEKLSEAPSHTAVLSADDREKIDNVVREITDPGIRESVRHVMEKDCLSRNRDQDKK